jgi:hypothetical protein
VERDKEKEGELRKEEDWCRGRTEEDELDLNGLG